MWLHRPSPTFQHQERAFSLVAEEKIEWDQTIAPPPRRRRATRRRNRNGEAKAIRACSSGTSRLPSKRPSSRQTRRWNDQFPYIGVWGQDRLIGAALIQPALCVAETLIYRTGTSGVHAAQIREAFSPSMRPSSKGSRSSEASARRLRIADQGVPATLGPADHGAELILSIPPTRARACSTRKPDTRSCRPTDITIKVFDAQEQPLHIPPTSGPGTEAQRHGHAARRARTRLYFEIGVLTAS